MCGKGTVELAWQYDTMTWDLLGGWNQTVVGSSVSDGVNGAMGESEGGASVLENDLVFHANWRNDREWTNRDGRDLLNGIMVDSEMMTRKLPIKPPKILLAHRDFTIPRQP